MSWHGNFKLKVLPKYIGFPIIVCTSIAFSRILNQWPPPSIRHAFIIPPLLADKPALADDCYIGPYSIIGDEVELGDGVRLDAHCVIDGKTTIGDGAHVYPFVSIGLPPQDLKYPGEHSQTRIGQRNHIREFVTIHRGTVGGGMLTQVGDDCLIMAQAHIAHDCFSATA